MNSFRRLLSFVTAFTLTLMMMVPLSLQPVMAQTTTGTIRGTVNDPSGGAIVDATVTARNQGTGAEVSTKTSGEGLYVIPNLNPGRYTVSVEAAGFKRQVVTDFEVRLDVNALDVALQAGGVTETVTVVAGTEEVVNRDQSQISATFETRKVEELPANAAGSGLDALALLIPGVVTAGGTSNINNNGAVLSVNGNRARSNNFQIDGSDNNDLSVGGPSFFVGNQDQVQEFQVITNNFSAQYGRNQGAIVNIVTKGGTNEFHGSAFEFFRDQKHLDTLNNIERRSVNVADPRSEDPLPFLSHVFGGTFGGPIVKNRAFFFGTYEGIRQKSEALLASGSLGILPTEFARLNAAFPGNPVIAAITTQSAFALPFGSPRPRTDLGPAEGSFCLNASGARVACGSAGAQGPFLLGGPYDVVNFGGQFYQAAFIERIVPTPFTQNEFSIRGDMKINDTNNFYARYLFQKGNNVNALGNTNGFTGDLPYTTKNLGGTYIRQISSSMVNELRLTYQDLKVGFGGGCTTGSPGCIPDPNDIALAQADINFTGVTGLLNPAASLRFIGPGSASGFPQGRASKLYQVANNLTMTRGRHSFIFGAELKKLTADVPFLPSFNGSFTFNSAARVINNAPSAFSLAVGEPIVSYSEYDQYYFIQDDWKVRDNLTLNLGLRYEYTGQPINDLRDLTLARESGPNPLFNPALPLESRVVPYIKPDTNNFAPRIGFAYTPRFAPNFFGEDATVIRGGFSIAYDPAFYNILLNVSNAAPVSALLTAGTGSLPASNSPLALPADFSGNNVRDRASAAGALPVGRLNPLLLTQVPVARDFHAPYSLQFSLGMQRQVNRNNVFEVRYVGTHGVSLFQTINRNPVFGNLYRGFTRNIATTAGVVPVTFPSFRQFIPEGAVPAVCVNDPATPDNEAACNDRLIPGRGRISERSNSAQSIYHSMQTRYQGRFLNNSLSLAANYTWSKTIDNASEIFAFAEASSVAQNPFDANRAERSISALDRPHAFSTNFLYDVPMFKEQRGFLGHLLGGFQINGAYVLTSGRPYTPGQFFNTLLGAGQTYLGDTAGESLRPFIGNPNADQRLVAISQVDAARLFGIPAENINGFYSLNALNTTGDVVTVTPNDVRFIFNGPGAARIFGTPFGNSPRNALRGPALNQLNLGIFKNTKVTENVRVQFRAEMFNALNHPNPGFGVVAASSIPDIFVEDASLAGSAFADKDDMTLARRTLQFGLRIIF